MHYLVPVASLPSEARGGPRLVIGGQEAGIPPRAVAPSSAIPHYSWGWRAWPPDPTLELVTIEWEMIDGDAQTAWEALPGVVPLPDQWEWGTAPVPAQITAKLPGPTPATFGAFMKQLPRGVQWHLLNR